MSRSARSLRAQKYADTGTAPSRSWRKAEVPLWRRVRVLNQPAASVPGDPAVLGIESYPSRLQRSYPKQTV